MKSIDPKPRSDEETLLMACHEGDVDAVTAMLGKGMDVDSRGPGGDTALMFAVLRQHVDVVKVLLEAGADPNARDDLDSRGEGRATPLMLAAMGPDVDLVKILLEAGADPNSKDSLGATPLMAAAHSSQGENVVVLLQGGADPIAESNDGFTALDFARQQAAEDVISILEEHRTREEGERRD